MHLISNSRVEHKKERCIKKTTVRRKTKQLKPQMLFTAAGQWHPLRQIGQWIKSLINTGAIHRVFGAKPIWAQLQITERCNLNCGYCTEHDNHGRHVPLETIRGWIRHCSELGVKHIGFIGGEPLMHPDFLELLDIARGYGMETGLTTNGFLLTEAYSHSLVEKGIIRLQLSIDCIEPNSVTRKAFNLLKPQLEYLRTMNIWIHVNSVIIPETIAQAYDLAQLLFGLEIPVAFSPAHDRGCLLTTPANESVVKFLEWLTRQKNDGNPVDMPQFLIDYYIDKMSGKSIPWICEGGCKAFYVDINGYFGTCSHKLSNHKFETVGETTLQKNHGRAKGCEDVCGVSCMVLNSLPFNRLDYVIKSDFLPFLRTKKQN